MSLPTHYPVAYATTTYPARGPFEAAAIHYLALEGWRLRPHPDGVVLNAPALATWAEVSDEAAHAVRVLEEHGWHVPVVYADDGGYDVWDGPVVLGSPSVPQVHVNVLAFQAQTQRTIHARLAAWAPIAHRLYNALVAQVAADAAAEAVEAVEGARIRTAYDHRRRARRRRGRNR